MRGIDRGIGSEFTTGYSEANMYNNSRQSIRVAFQLGFLALLVLVGLNYQAILDQYALRTYKPDAFVGGFEQRIQLTDAARAIFYRAQPKVEPKAQFNRDCDTSLNELELGCFYGGKIFILRIDNADLAREMDVVAAHELLHGVWVRMSAKERQRVGEELQRVYDTVVDDELRERMAGYQRTEPGEELNELHSILGTEYADISPVLETHYAKYFMKRSQIVAAHASYTSVFTTRRAELERELAEIRTKKAELAVLNRQMESYKSAGEIARYNSLVPRQNRLVDDINGRIQSYRRAVDEYNALSKSLESEEITDTESLAQ